MKKLYVFLFISVASVAGAQLTQANHAPVDGESYDMYPVDPTSVNYMPAGTGITWNFSAATVSTSAVQNFTVSNVSLPAYPAANVAVGSGTGNVSYLSSSAASLLYHGGNISVQTVEANLTYTSPALYADYNGTMGTASTTATGGSINVTAPQQAPGVFTGTSSTVVDGTGTLVLPAGTFSNVMRVRNTQTLDFSLAGGLFTGILTMDLFEWYNSGTKAPLFTVTSGTAIVLGQTYVETLVSVNKLGVNTGTASIAEQTVGSISVYPQPGLHSLNVTNLPVPTASMEVFDLAGRRVATYDLQQKGNVIDISGYPGGLFLYTIKNATGQQVHSGRFTVGR